MKKKLFNLKKWLTLPDAARHLSIVFGEEVTEADVLRLVLDRQLRLSVNFVNPVLVMRGEIGAPERSEESESLARGMGTFDPKVFYSTAILIRESEKREEMLWFNDRGKTWIKGIYDLPMFGDEASEIEDRYMELAGGPALKTVGHEYGSFVGSLDSELFRLLDEEHDGKMPLWGLPEEDAMFVVTTEALREFEQSVNEEQKESPKITDNTLLATIAALLANFPSGKEPTGKDLEKAANVVGVKISDDSLRKALKTAKALWRLKPNRQEDLPT